MTLATRLHWSLTCLACCVAACGGRAVNLDQQSSDSPAPAGGATGHAVEKAPLSDAINDFWVDDSRIYWSTWGSLKAQSCVYEQCGSTLVNYGYSHGPISSSGSDVFFAPLPSGAVIRKRSTVIRCPKLGCPAEPERFLQDGPLDLFPLRSDEQYLYWRSTFDIYRCPLANCGEIPELVAKSNSSSGPLLLDGPNVYWWTFTEDPPSEGSPTAIYAAPKDGSGSPSKLTSTGPDSSVLVYREPLVAVAADTLYWLDPSSHVVSCPLVGCGDTPPTVLVATGTEKASLWVDSANLYWLNIEGWNGSNNSALGTVEFCPIAGCGEGVKPKSITANDTRRFALDSSYVYWLRAENADERSLLDKGVYRTAKPTFAP